MSYYIKSLPTKKSEPKWKVQFISYKRMHFKQIKNSKSKKARKTWDISKDRWKGLGFYKYMTISEARVRARQLNKQEFLKEQEERLKKKQQKEKKQRDRFDSKLPVEFVLEFEKRFVRKSQLPPERRYNSNRAMRRWSATQKLIMAIDEEPSEWYYNIYEFYDYFSERKLSVRYVNEVLKFVNLWGFFISKKMGRPFMQIPTPRGYERRKIVEAFYSNPSHKKKVSKPITPEMLNKAKPKLKMEHYNWLYLSVWFGLRPKEIDNLHDLSMWKVEKLFNGRYVLWVYQTKVIALPEEDRWKPIPVLFREQEKAVKILKSDNFKRPIVKTIRTHLSQNVSLYGGRKGFTDLMLSKGHTLENISVWMGHSTIHRTWKSYKNRRKYHVQYGT